MSIPVSIQLPLDDRPWTIGYSGELVLPQAYGLLDRAPPRR
ncbi:MAG: hypothetical protein ACO331_00080 [Prochlorothrix sp.]